MGFLVGGIPTPLKNMKVSWDDEIPHMWKNKIDVPNQQPVFNGDFIISYGCFMFVDVVKKTCWFYGSLWWWIGMESYFNGTYPLVIKHGWKIHLVRWFYDFPQLFQLLFPPFSIATFDERRVNFPTSNEKKSTLGILNDPVCLSWPRIYKSVDPNLEHWFF